MFKKFLFMLSVSIAILSAEVVPEAAINMVKSNPSLLNTPQAKAAMQAEGISKEQVMEKLNLSVDGGKKSQKIDKATNNIVEKSKNSDTVKTVKVKLNYIYQNPLVYKENLNILKKIKSKQNRTSTTTLHRFSRRFFSNKNSLNPASMPVPDYYIINKGDTVSIWIYGGIDKNLNKVVDNYGNINIENFGPIQVAGLEFKKAREIISSQLSHAFSNANVAVNISSYSTIQVILAGNVSAAGIYNLSSLSTLKDLLIASGGIKSNGSVRNITIKRAGRVLKKVDLYGLLTGKKDYKPTILRTGDTVFIPKAYKIAGIDGAVYNRALFELKRGETLYDLLQYAGGMKPNASKFGIKVSRYDNNQNITMRSVDYKDSRKEVLKNGDSVYVYSIDAVHKKSIYIYGNVVRPGSRGYTKGMTLGGFIKKEIKNVGLKGLFLDNTLFNYAMIKRKSRDLTTRVISFNLGKIIAGTSDVSLRADDELYIFNKLDNQINPYVTISGNVLIKSGKYQYYSGLKVIDLIEIAGIKAPYDTSKIKVTSYDTKDFMPRIDFISLDDAKHYNLAPYSEVSLFDYYSVNHIPTATINGEVNYPDTYKIDGTTTLAKLIKLAGGLTQRAYEDRCEIVRYSVRNGKREKRTINLSLLDAKKFMIDRFDEVTIFKIPKWSERKTVTLYGEVKFPGTYVIESGDKLSDIITRAGGFTDEAFLYGAVFTRESIKNLQKKRLKESLVKLKQKSIILSNSPRGAGETGKANYSEVANMIDSLSKEAEKLEPVGRITIALDRDIDKFRQSQSNLTLKDKDRLYVPSFNDTVLVIGEVMNPTAIIYNSDNIVDYLEKAGGLTNLADESNIYVVHANGEAKKYKTNIFSSGMSIKTGDVIVVPQELVTTTGMQFTKDVAGILYQFAITAASLKTVGAL